MRNVPVRITRAEHSVKAVQHAPVANGEAVKAEWLLATYGLVGFYCTKFYGFTCIVTTRCYEGCKS